MSLPEASPYGGRYRIKERIGRGGMAEVYLAVASGAAGFEREVVLKRLLPHIAADPGMAAAFLEEARLLSQLNHPHIAQVYDVAEGPEGVYLVMEYIAGHDLREVMEKQAGKLDPGLAALITRDVCEALEHGFQRPDGAGVPLKLIHRDISLSNIMISMTGTVKLVDFGLAKALTNFDREHTAEGVVKGKWSYVAPEVLRGKVADHRSDLWSLAVVLWEMCAGRKMYRPSGDIVLVLADRERPPPPLSKVAPEAGAALDAITGKALALDPSWRYESAEAMAAALDEVVHEHRIRPAQLVDLMTRLFDPKRLRATQSMQRVELDPVGEVGDTTTDRSQTVPRDPRSLGAAAFASPAPARVSTPPRPAGASHHGSARPPQPPPEGTPTPVARTDEAPVPPPAPSSPVPTPTPITPMPPAPPAPSLLAAPMPLPPALAPMLALAVPETTRPGRSGLPGRATGYATAAPTRITPGGRRQGLILIALMAVLLLLAAWALVYLVA